MEWSFVTPASKIDGAAGPSGIDAAVHVYLLSLMTCVTLLHPLLKAAMHSLFHSSTTQAVLLADASNAFSSLNQYVSLHNLLPPLYQCL